jgi:hypothetical protein
MENQDSQGGTCVFGIDGAIRHVKIKIKTHPGGCGVSVGCGHKKDTKSRAGDNIM